MKRKERLGTGQGHQVHTVSETELRESLGLLLEARQSRATAQDTVTVRSEPVMRGL